MKLQRVRLVSMAQDRLLRVRSITTFTTLKEYTVT
jgi:hypothetical protein